MGSFLGGMTFACLVSINLRQEKVSITLRPSSVDQFKTGEGLKVIELNGVTAEAAHMYDPKHSVFYAYKTLLKQWLVAYRIGAANIAAGIAPKTSVIALLRHLKLSLS